MNIMEGFSRDQYIKDEVAKLIADYDINLVFETGTYKGNTTRELSSMVKSVHTCEVNESFYNEAKQNLADISNVMMYHGSSPNMIEHFKLNVLGDAERNILFYLDAHWNGTPLIDELKTIGKYFKDVVIAIHDFKVPGKDFGYDSYGGQDYTFDWIKEHLDSIYPNGYGWKYNDKASGSYRGIIYIYPEQIINNNTEKQQTPKEVQTEPAVSTELDELIAKYNALKPGKKRSKAGKALKEEIIKKGGQV